MNVVGGARAHVSGWGGLNPFLSSRHRREGSHPQGVQSQAGPVGVSICLSAQLWVEPEGPASGPQPTLLQVQLVTLF